MEKNRNIKRYYSSRNGVMGVDSNIFRTSSISGYNYFFGSANLESNNRNRFKNSVNVRILRDIWTLITSPVN